MSNWYLITKNQVSESGVSLVDTNINFVSADSLTSVGFFIDGYIIPKCSSDVKTHGNQYELLILLWKMYGERFIDQIKGVFVIIIRTHERILLFNDHLGLNKFFFRSINGANYFSNNLFRITQNYSLKLDEVGIGLFLLFEHFIDGRTLFEEVYYSEYATKLILNHEKVQLQRYWNESELLYDHAVNRISMTDFPDFWRELIATYIRTLSPKEITMTITGGNDSRMILAGVISSGYKTDLFSFGNPESNDGVIAAKIANATSFNYSNHFVAEPNSKWFLDYAEKLIELGNPLINVHRVHRLDAIENEFLNNSSLEAVFGGFMGGDFTKGIIYDDYITAKYYRYINLEGKDLQSSIVSILDQNYFKHNNSLIDNLLGSIQDKAWIKNRDKIHREFHYLFEITGSLHDYQDINIFRSKIKYSINPFMDIDFLKLLFASGYSMLAKDNSKARGINRLDYAKLHMYVTHKLAPHLSDIPYAKKGYYTARETFGSKSILLYKRALRYKFGKKYPQNFPYGEWIRDSVKEVLEQRHPEIIDNLFDVKRYKLQLDSSKNVHTEGYWHQYTNLTNIILQSNKYVGI